MTVSELIKVLNQCPPEALVHVPCGNREQTIGPCVEVYVHSDGSGVIIEGADADLFFGL